MKFLHMSYDSGDKDSEPALVVMKGNGKDMKLVVARIGDKAAMLYRVLTDQSCDFDIIIRKDWWKIEVINKPRGMGKTYDLIMESARTGIPIITTCNSNYIVDMAKDMGVCIPEPMTYHRYIQYKEEGQFICNPKWQRKVLIDDVDMLLGKLLEAKVEKVTYTDSKIRSENIHDIDVQIDLMNKLLGVNKIFDLPAMRYVLKKLNERKEKMEDDNNMPTKFTIDPVGTLFINGEYLGKGILSASGISRMDIITDVNVIVPNKVVEITFADGKKEKSVCREPDVFSMEQAIAICISKHIMGGSGLYNNAVKAGMKVYENQLKAEKEKKSEEERIAKRRAKREAYKKRRAEKIALAESERRAAEREEQIEIQKEAYLRAMREVNEK